MMFAISSTSLSNPFVVLNVVLILLTFVHVGSAATPDDWRGRSIYQLITDRFALTNGSTDVECNTADKKRCGGTWRGIINQLDYIQGMGFTAIWISPIVKGIETSTAGENYHGFWQQDLNQLNPYFGTPEDLKELSKKLHDRDMYLMVDILANNLAWPGPGGAVEYGKFPAPFNQKSAFHNFCYISNYSDVRNYQQCWLGNDQVSLPDINTESQEIRNYFHTWAQNIVSDYSIDGFRVDATKHVQKGFWEDFQKSVNTTYTVGEVFTEVPTEACEYMVHGLSAVLNFPLLYRIVEIFAHPENPAKNVQGTLEDLKFNCTDTTLLGTFSENHDLPRFASAIGDLSNRKNAIVFAMLGDGIPVAYYGQEQQFDGGSDPGNREALWISNYNTSAPLYELMKRVNIARNAMVKAATSTVYSGYWKHKSKIIMSDDNVVVTRKGFDVSIVSVVTNKGSGAKDFGPHSISDTNWKGSTEIVDVLSCTIIKTGSYGEFQTTVRKGNPQVWIPTSVIGTDLNKICPSTTRTSGASVAGPTLTLSLACIAIAFAAFL